MSGKSNKPTETTTANSVRREANPEVKSADNFDDTNETVDKKLAGLSKTEKATGVRDEELDRRFTVDPDPSKNSDLNKVKQPWEDYQNQAEALEAADNKAAADRLQAEHKEAAKEKN